MGVVWHARNLQTGQEVALKVIHTGSDADPAEVERFLTEARAGSRLQHPHIVRVFHFGSAEEQHFFTMELLTCGTLQDRLRHGPLPPRAAARLLCQAAGAIQHAHDHKVLHRDLKPSNLLLAGSPCVADGSGSSSSPVSADTLTLGAIAQAGDSWAIKVADFGLARLLDVTGRQTGTGDVFGTPSYMAPEQVGGHRQAQDERTDVHGLGAVLYACLTGRPPFQAATAAETLFQVLWSESVPVRALVPGVPRELEAVCLKCLEKDPAQRYASAGELADDLDRWLAGKPVLARPAGSLTWALKWVKRHLVTSALAAGMALVLLAGVVVSGYFALTAASEAKAARAAEQEADNRATAERAAKALAQAETIRADTKTAEARRALEKAQEALDRTKRALYVGNLVQAQREHAEGNPARALEVLISCEPGLRHFEHHHLWTRFSALQTYPVSRAGVFALACLPDGKRFATGSGDGSVRVHDAASGRELLRIEHEQPITCLAFSRDGKQLLSGDGHPFLPGNPGVIRVHDPDTGKKLLEIRGHAAGVLALDWAPDAKRIVSGGVDRTIKVHDAQTGKELLSLKGHRGEISALQFSPDGKRIAGGGQDNVVRVWDAGTGQALFSMEEHRDRVYGVAFSPDGKRLASASHDQTVRLWDAQTGKPQLLLTGPVDGFRNVTFRPDGRQLAAGAWDNTVRVWDVRTGRELHSLRGHALPITAIGYLPGANRLLSASGDCFRTTRQGEVKAWDAEKGQDGLVLRGHQERVTSAAFSPDGKRIASGSCDNTIRIWDLDRPEKPLVLRGHSYQVLSVAWDPEGRRVVSGTYIGEGKVWDASTGKTLLTLTGHVHQVEGVAFSPDGKLIVSAGRDGTIRFWDAGTGRQLRCLRGHSLPLTAVAFSPDGKSIVSSSGDFWYPDRPGEIKFWDVATGQELRSLKARDHGFFCLAVSRDGKRILAGGMDRTVKVWDAEKGALLHTLTGHALPVMSVAFSPDGKRILSSGGDPLNGSRPGEIRIWDASNGLELLSLMGHSRAVTAVAFNRDTTRILSASWDHTLKVWEAHRRQQ
jgi:WD40 repeat protein